MPHDATRRAEGPTQGTHTGDPHRGDPHRRPTQGTQTGDPHRREGPTEDLPPERRATQGTHTGHTPTMSALIRILLFPILRSPRFKSAQTASQEPSCLKPDLLVCFLSFIF